MNFLVWYFRHPLENAIFPGEPHRTWTDDEEWPLSLEGIGDRQGLKLKKNGMSSIKKVSTILPKSVAFWNKTFLKYSSLFPRARA